MSDDPNKLSKINKLARTFGILNGNDIEENIEANIFIPDSSQTIKEQNTSTGDPFGSDDLLMLTSNNLPNLIHTENGPDCELIYNGKNILWKEKEKIKIKNKNAELMSNNTLLSFLSESGSNTNDLYLIEGDTETLTYKQSYFTLQKSLLINSTPELQTSVENIGEINNIQTIITGTDNINLINCKNMNKYYRSLNKNLINKNLSVSNKNIEDKEINLLGGYGRTASILISNNMDLFDSDKHVKISDVLYIKGINNKGYLYKENDILYINEDLFNNIKFKVTNVSKNTLKEKNIISDFNRSINNKSFSDFSSFNINMNCVLYSSIYTSDSKKITTTDLKDVNITFNLVNINNITCKNINKYYTSLLKNPTNNYSSFLNRNQLNKKNILFARLIHNKYNDDSLDKDLYDYLIIKNIIVTGLINKNSFFSIKIFSFDIVKDSDINNIMSDKENGGKKYEFDLSNIPNSILEKEILYNNTSNNTININENYDLNIAVKNDRPINNQGKKLIYGIISSHSEK